MLVLISQEITCIMEKLLEFWFLSVKRSYEVAGTHIHLLDTFWTGFC
jgi:hypothetical protein